MAPSAHTKNLELILDIDSAVPAHVTGDPARFRQVLLNLIGNAVKFTQSGEVVVRASVFRGEARPLLRIEVADTGIGIAPAVQSNLFTAFIQADNSTTRRFGGTGLGLAIARRLVDLMGGEMGVESAEGYGATFWFTADLNLDAAAPVRGGDPELAGCRVLIVDRNASSRAVLARYAASWGMQPVAVSDSAGALAAFQSAQLADRAFDAALIDDVDLLRQTASHPPSAATRLIMLARSGVLPGGSVEASRVSKPVKRSAFRACLCATAVAVHQDTPSAPGPRRGRILIAEDNPVNQRVARLQVERLGFEADVVSNGEEALHALGSLAYTLVLMDCQMPVMDGYAATRELRRREDGRCHIPVIA
jgi:CheY-like chemotaxis protein